MDMHRAVDVSEAETPLINRALPQRGKSEKYNEAARWTVLWIVRHSTCMRQCVGKLSLFAFAYSTHYAIYYIATELIAIKWVLVKPLLLSKVSNMSMILVLILTGQCVGHLITICDENVKEKTKKSKFWFYGTRAIGHIARYAATASFTLFSSLLGYQSQETQVFERMLWSFATFLVMVSMAFWTTENYGALDGILGVILGLIVKNKDDDKRVAHMVWTALVPAIGHFFIPTGDFLKDWADSPTNGEGGDGRSSISSSQVEQRVAANEESSVNISSSSVARRVVINEPIVAPDAAAGFLPLGPLLTCSGRYVVVMILYYYVIKCYNPDHRSRGVRKEPVVAPKGVREERVVAPGGVREESVVSPEAIDILASRDAADIPPRTDTEIVSHPSEENPPAGPCPCIITRQLAEWLILYGVLLITYCYLLPNRWLT